MVGTQTIMQKILVSYSYAQGEKVEFF